VTSSGWIGVGPSTAPKQPWEQREEEWKQRRDPGCTCEFCGGTGFYFTVDPKSNGAVWSRGPNAGLHVSDADFRCANTPRVYAVGGGCGPVTINPPTKPDTGLAAVIAAIAPKTGHRCRVCKVNNEYAAANQSDGTYVCFECR